MPDPTPDSLLPLPTAVFHILIALADRERHGYSIMQDVAARTGGKVQLSAGTLYSAVRRMLEQRLIDELAESPHPSSSDERRRYGKADRGGGSRTAVRPAAAGPSRRAGVGCVMRVPAAYRALLRCYPAAFREEYGGQMRLMSAEQLGEARRGGPLPTAVVSAGATFDALTIAPKEHCHVILQDLRYFGDPIPGPGHRSQYRDLQPLE